MKSKWLRVKYRQEVPSLEPRERVASRSCGAGPAQAGYRGASAAPPGLTLHQPVVIAPEGELDVATVGGFRRGLAQAAREAEGGLVVDLTEVSFIDSSALGAIVELQNQRRRSEQRLAVVVPSGSAVAVALNLSGLRDRLPLFETRQAALES